MGAADAATQPPEGVMADATAALPSDGTAPRVIAEKRGAALVSLRLASGRRLRPLVPEPLAVECLLPGLALYAVAAFRYAELRVGHETGSVRGWRDVVDVTIMVPVRSTDRDAAWFVTRLYNSSPEVVAWAAGHGLGKLPAAIEWRADGRDVTVRMDSPAGGGERLVIRGRRRFPLPAWLWRLGPLRATARSWLLTADAGSIRRFAVGCRSIGPAAYCSVSCVGSGLTLPAAWLSVGCMLDGFSDFLIEAPPPG